MIRRLTTVLEALTKWGVRYGPYVDAAVLEGAALSGADEPESAAATNRVGAVDGQLIRRMAAQEV